MTQTETVDTKKICFSLDEIDLKVPNIVRDQRFRDLMQLMDRIEKENPIGLYLYPNQNIYWLAHVSIGPCIKKAKDYFEQEAFFDAALRNKGVVSPIFNDEISELVFDGTTITVHYIKKFDDGLIQLAGFGDEWETRPNTCWAIYGHIVSERGK